MPVIYKCRNCGYILYNSDEPEKYGIQKHYGIPTPSEIIYWYGGSCPKCGKPLKKPSPDDISITGKVEVWSD